MSKFSNALSEIAMTAGIVYEIICGMFPIAVITMGVIASGCGH